MIYVITKTTNSSANRIVYNLCFSKIPAIKPIASSIRLKGGNTIIKTRTMPEIVAGHNAPHDLRM